MIDFQALSNSIERGCHKRPVCDWVEHCMKQIKQSDGLKLLIKGLVLRKFLACSFMICDCVTSICFTSTIFALESQFFQQNYWCKVHILQHI